MNALELLKRSYWPAFGLLSAAILAWQLRGPAHLWSAAAATGLTRPGGAATSTDASRGAAPAEPSPAVAAEGRLATYPGGQVVVSTDLAGTIVRLDVKERDRVRKGQVIAELRADDLRAQLAEARAHVAEAEADMRFSDLDASRAERLFSAQVGTQATLDRARSNRDAAYARRATAEAEVRRLAATLAKTVIVAPITATVIARPAQPGEHIDSGAPILTLADLDHTRIEAEVDEFDAARVALGAPVRVTAEGYDGRSWKAYVEEIPEAVVSRSLRPQDPGRPSDTRVLVVKVALAEASPLKLGQRVEVAIGAAPAGRLQAAPGGGFPRPAARLRR